MATKPFIGVKQIFYGDVFTSAPTPATLKTWMQSATEVKNSHDGTFSYSQDDPSVTDYKNELTGQPYYRDPTDSGNKTIKFTIGVYDFADKAELQGGEVITDSDTTTAIGWKAASAPQMIYKGVVAITKTGNVVVFTNASIIGKTEMAEKNMGLGITAVAMDNDTAGVAGEYWFSAESMVDDDDNG